MAIIRYMLGTGGSQMYRFQISAMIHGLWYPLSYHLTEGTAMHAKAELKKNHPGNTYKVSYR